MGHSSILTLTEEPTSKKRWGTPEEKYRRLCMVCLLCRYTYYCHATSLITEDQYNSLESLILTIEDKDRVIIHPRSPTVTVGSDREEDYPVSARILWRAHSADGVLSELWPVIKSFIEDARETWGLMNETQGTEVQS